MSVWEWLYAAVVIAVGGVLVHTFVSATIDAHGEAWWFMPAAMGVGVGTGLLGRLLGEAHARRSAVRATPPPP